MFTPILAKKACRTWSDIDDKPTLSIRKSILASSLMVVSASSLRPTLEFWADCRHIEKWESQRSCFSCALQWQSVTQWRDFVPLGKAAESSHVTGIPKRGQVFVEVKMAASQVRAHDRKRKDGMTSDEVVVSSLKKLSKAEKVDGTSARAGVEFSEEITDRCLLLTETIRWTASQFDNADGDAVRWKSKPIMFSLGRELFLIE